MTVKEERIFYNAKIFTSNPEKPYASALAVRDGRITWIGEQNDLEKLDNSAIDLKGRRVIPSFIDAHLHPLLLAKTSKQIAATPPNVYSIKELQEKIRKQREIQGSDSWIKGWGYDEGKLSEGCAPTRWDLDKAAPDLPVIVTRTCSHIAVVNSKALEIAGITKDTPNPPGGKIDKDAEGEPTGILRENARNLVLQHMPAESFEENVQALAELSPKLLAKGITAIADLMSRVEPIDFFDLYNEAHNRGLKQRTVLYYKWQDIEKNPLIDKSKLSNQNPVYVGGVKILSDGSVSGQTAWVNKPYLGDGENYGIPMTSEEELLAAAKGAKQNKIQLVVHAMGTQAIDLIINTFYGKKGWLTDIPSIRIEHAAMPSAQALKRAAEMGIAFVPQSIFLFAEIESYLKNLGAEWTRQTYPIRDMLDAGIKIALSSDAPATAWADPVNPFVGLKSAVTRKAYDGTDTGQKQRIDICTAITLYTRAAQEITGILDVGQLTPGYHADFIVLDQDILEIENEKIDQVSVDETYMGGNWFIRKKG